MISEFGVTRWGKAWLKMLESPTVIQPQPQLLKARSLVRNDNVRELRTSAGRVTALVSDNSARTVEVTFDRWPEEVASAVGSALTASGSAAAIGAGDLPDELFTLLRDLGADLAPTKSPWEGSCTCSSRHRPCAHVSACIYALVHAIDEEPAIAIALRTDHELGRAADASGRRIHIQDLDPETFYSTASASKD